MKKTTQFRQLIEEGRVIERPDLAVSFAEINDLMGWGPFGKWGDGS